jgi:hypothetical protein
LWTLSLLALGCSDGSGDGTGGNGDADTDTDADTDADSDADTDSDTTTPLPEADSPLVINEVVASNLSGLQDASLAFPDWLEIYNDSGAEVSLAGHFLSDEHDWPDKWAFPPSAVIAAHGYLVVMCDGDVLDSSTGELHSSFRLQADGEWLAITVDEAGGIASADTIDYPLLGTDVAYARMPDGTGEFQDDPTPTPNAANE